MNLQRIFTKDLIFCSISFKKAYRIFIAIILAIIACCPDIYASSEVQNTIEVTATSVITNNFYEKYTIVGKSRAENSKTYYAKVEGTVDSVPVHPGQSVKKGDVILTIDFEIAEAIRAKAEASYESAKSTYDRDFSLWSKKIITKDVLDKSRVALETAKADLATQDDKYLHMIIKAPFDGSIGALPAYVGKDTKINDYLFTIIASGGKIISIELPESLNNKINNNSEVSLVDNQGSNVSGHIIAISDYLNDNGTITANLAFPTDTKILHGSYVEIEIIYNRHFGLALPEKLVLKNNKGNFIYKVEKDNKVKQIYVQTKTRSNNLIEISSSEIHEGDIVVCDGLTKVHDGARVRLKDDAGDIVTGNSKESSTKTAPLEDK